MRGRLGTTAIMAAALVISSAAVAHDGTTMEHGTSAMEKPAKPEAASTTAYRKSMEKMHAGMMNESYTGDADLDFVNGMIPHHQGAVDMAEIEMKYGKDPKLKKLAATIYAGQKREILFMKKWREAHQAKQ